MGVQSKFLTSPKLKLTAKRPRKHLKSYPKSPKTLGEKIKKHRMDLGLSQKDVAKFVGVATDTVTYWERGRHQPYKRYLKRIKQFLKEK